MFLSTIQVISGFNRARGTQLSEMSADSQNLVNQLQNLKNTISKIKSLGILNSSNELITNKVQQIKDLEAEENKWKPILDFLSEIKKNQDEVIASNTDNQIEMLRSDNLRIQNLLPNL